MTRIRSVFIFFLIFTSFSVVQSCDFKETDSSNYEYVRPSVTRTGKVRKSYVRAKVSTKKHAYKSQQKSKYYYRTRGKYLRKRK